jgi:hypothetical protein
MCIGASDRMTFPLPNVIGALADALFQIHRHLFFPEKTFRPTQLRQLQGRT